MHVWHSLDRENLFLRYVGQERSQQEHHHQQTADNQERVLHSRDNGSVQKLVKLLLYIWWQCGVKFLAFNCGNRFTSIFQGNHNLGTFLVTYLDAIIT